MSGKNKAQAVKDCFFGPIRPQAPGSILQFHPDFTLVADEDALSLVANQLCYRFFTGSRIRLPVSFFCARIPRLRRIWKGEYVYRLYAAYR